MGVSISLARAPSRVIADDEVGLSGGVLLVNQVSSQRGRTGNRDIDIPPRLSDSTTQSLRT
jgi:hypothetical protein